MDPQFVLWPFVVIGAAILLIAILQFNSLVGLRQLVRNSWADVDVFLKRRAELVPNLVEAVKAYAAHERTVLEAVVEARARAATLAGSPARRAEAEGELAHGLVQVLAVAENYPELKASANFADLQRQLGEAERHIADARQYYNACVRDFNTKIESFPSNVVAAMGAFRQAEFFEAESPAEREAPVVRT